MKSPPVLRRVGSACVAALVLSLLPAPANAQIAAGKSKFLGNIIGGSVPSNFATYWNQITPENAGKWESVERTRGVMNWAALDTAYAYAQSNGFKFKEHTLIWGAQYPAWITTLSTADQRTEIEEWMRLLSERYPDLWAIDVVNEPVKTPLPFKDALGGDGTTGWDWVITSFQLARQYFPNAKLFINEYGTENDATARAQMIAIINLLKERSLIDGIGIQAHAFNLDNMTAAQMTACLDAYAATGLDLYITELDIRGPAQTEASQSAQYQVIFPAIWAHPAVKGVTLWGYIVGQTWLANTGIVNSDGTERAAMTWLKGYVTGNLAPAITTQPASQTVAAGASVTFSVIATGTTPLSYQWNFNGAAIPGATSASYSISNAQPASAGNYTVTVSNSVGSITSSIATLTVNTPPAPPPSSSGGGGGGAPSAWFLVVLSLAALLRRWRTRTA
jgi:endo-1,4-beta-xylanase